MIRHMLTTDDNPFDPFDQYKDWYAWDASHGYHSPSLLARVTNTSDELSDVDSALAIEQGIDEVVQYNLSGHHKKVSREFKNVFADNSEPL